MRGGFRVAALVALGVVVAGCSHDDNNAGGSTTTTAAKAPFDACSLSPAALQAAGLDPATKSKGLLGVEIPDSTTCRWTGKDYNVVLSASSTMTADQATQGGLHLAGVTVAGRPATTFSVGADDPDHDCYMVIPFQGGGLALFQVGRSGLTQDRTPACQSAQRVGDQLATELPK